MALKTIIKRLPVYLMLAIAGWAFVLPGNAAADVMTSQQLHLLSESPNWVSKQCGGAGPTSSSNSLGNVFILGDSITVRAESEYEQAFQTAGVALTTDGSSSRAIGQEGIDGNKLSGLDAIKKDTDSIKQADAVVVALGTNGGTNNENIQKVTKAIEGINPTAKLYWIDTFVLNRPAYNRDVIAPANEAIYGQADAQNYQVISWFNEVDQTDDPKAPSGNETDKHNYIDTRDSLNVHPTSDGSQALANLVVNAVINGSRTDTSGSGQCCTTGGATLSGKDNKEKVWNFFKSKGLSDAQVAGIMGNMAHESGFDPQIMQKNGQDSKDPYDAGDLGWALIQWSGNGNTGRSTGDKVTHAYQDSGVSGPIYELSTQLDLVWQHMHNHPVITKPFDLNHFKSITNEREATLYFLSQIEAGTDPDGIREKNATDIFKELGGAGSGSTSTDTGGSVNCGGNNTSSPNCAGATGTTKILCEAKKYDPVSYVWGGGHAGGKKYHEQCSTIGDDPACGLDCSGLVSVAVYDAFGNNQSWVVGGFMTDTTNWKEVNFNDVQGGDLIVPNSGHVEIVDHVVGKKVYTFGAHSAHRPQPDQVGPTNFRDGTNPNYKYYRYVGPIN
jgi:lysophospholipase L1-like esterase/cell wall-associated NlpC family hydrolase